MSSPYRFKAPPDPEMQTILVAKHGQYLLAPSKPSKNLPILCGFHGYADTAEKQLELLQAIPLAQPWLCCAVQSLNLFYNKSMNIVGNWMTSFDREHAITDNVAYVDAVVAELQSKFSASNKVVYLGFSQGVPMAYRAAILGSHSCAGLIVLAGDFPPELASRDLRELPPILLCRGRQDTIMPQEQIDKDQAIFEGQGVDCEVFLFDGDHSATEEFFRKAAEFLNKIDDRS